MFKWAILGVFIAGSLYSNALTSSTEPGFGDLIHRVESSLTPNANDKLFIRFTTPLDKIGVQTEVLYGEGATLKNTYQYWYYEGGGVTNFLEKCFLELSQANASFLQMNIVLDKKKDRIYRLVLDHDQDMGSITSITVSVNGQALKSNYASYYFPGRGDDNWFVGNERDITSFLQSGNNQIIIQLNEGDPQRHEWEYWPAFEDPRYPLKPYCLQSLKITEEVQTDH